MGKPRRIGPIPRLNVWATPYDTGVFGNRTPREYIQAAFREEYFNNDCALECLRVFQNWQASQNIDHELRPDGTPYDPTGVLSDAEMLRVLEAFRAASKIEYDKMVACRDRCYFAYSFGLSM